MNKATRSDAAVGKDNWFQLIQDKCCLFSNAHCNKALLSYLYYDKKMHLANVPMQLPGTIAHFTAYLRGGMVQMG